MALFVDILSWFLLGGGASFAIISGIGILAVLKFFHYRDLGHAGRADASEGGD